MKEGGNSLWCRGGVIEQREEEDIDKDKIEFIRIQLVSQGGKKGEGLTEAGREGLLNT